MLKHLFSTKHSHPDQSHFTFPQMAFIVLSSGRGICITPGNLSHSLGMPDCNKRTHFSREGILPECELLEMYYHWSFQCKIHHFQDPGWLQLSHVLQLPLLWQFYSRKNTPWNRTEFIIPRPLPITQHFIQILFSLKSLNPWLNMEIPCIHQSV